MSTDLLRIRYRDFYDVPRALLLEYQGTWYFLDCPFSELEDDYGDEYRVYQLAGFAEADLEDVFWAGLPGDARCVGTVPIASVEFDSTRRHTVRASFFGRLELQVQKGGLGDSEAAIPLVEAGHTVTIVRASTVADSMRRQRAAKSLTEA